MDNENAGGSTPDGSHAKGTELRIRGFKYYCVICGLVDTGITRFRFPQAAKERDQWLAFSGMELGYLKQSHRLCIKHFKETDLIMKGTRCLLKPGAIPTLNEMESVEEPAIDINVEEDISEAFSSTELKAIEEVFLECGGPQQPSLPLHLNEISEDDCGSCQLALRLLKVSKRELAEHLQQIKILQKNNEILEKTIVDLLKGSATTQENAESRLSEAEVDADILLGSDIPTDTESNASNLSFEMNCVDVTSTEDTGMNAPDDTVEEGKSDPLTIAIDEDIDSLDTGPTARPAKAPCPHCKKLYSINFIRRHISLVHMPEAALQKCQYCSKSFSALGLRLHIKQVHHNRRYTCNVCSTIFKSETSLRRHALNHNIKRERKFTCEVCGLIFMSLSNLTGHQTTHDGERKPKFACDQCDRTFYYKSALTTHKYVHSSNAAQCSECNKRFPRSLDLAIHMRTHSGEKPFKCDLCSKGFVHEVQYNRHLLQHQGHVFKCDICGEGLKSYNALNLHRKKHTGMSLQCAICNREFMSPSKAILHVRRVHQIPTEDSDAYLLNIKQNTYVPRKNRLANT